MPLGTPTHVGPILALVPGMVRTPSIPDSSNYAYLNTLGLQELLDREACKLTLRGHSIICAVSVDPGDRRSPE
jgi:hypothetical protein